MEERVDIVVDSSSAKRGIDVLVDSVNRMTGALYKAETATNKLFDHMDVGLRRFESALTSARNILMSFTVVIGVFKQLGQEFTRFQAFISAMSVSVGGVKRAREEYQFLMEMSDKLGISVNSLSHNYSQLAAATVNTAVTTDKLRSIFESFSVAARVMHLSGIDTRLMFYALTQMVSKGSVSMEELRRQLGEKLPGAMKIAASSVNATSDELEAAIRKGIVDPIKFLPIFADAVRATFGPGLVNAMTAFDAELNRVSNNLQKLIIVMFDLGVADAFTKVLKEINRILSDPTIGEEFAKALKNVADEVTNFLKTIGPEEVRSFMTGFSNALTLIGNAASNILPIMKELAKYMGLIATAWLTVKGMTLGAAAGTAIAGPGAGTIGGAIIGGVGGFGTAMSIGNALDNIGKPNQPGSAVSGKIRRAEVLAEENLNNWYFTEGPGKTQHTLADVLSGAGKGKTTPMDTFIQMLKERDAGTGEEGNRYEAFRSRATQLSKKNPERLQEALEIIDKLEARGDEFAPLINRIDGMIDRQNSMTPAIIDRAVQDMIVKYPRALAKHDEALKAAAIFRTQYEEKLAREQTLFDEKQNEIVRRLEVEKQLYTEQFDLIGKGADERERTVRQLELEKRLEEQIVQLRAEALREGRIFDEAVFRQRGGFAISSVIDELKRLQAATNSVEAGFLNASAAYMDMSTNLARSVGNLWTFTLNGIEDALTDMVMKGKASFRELSDAIINEILRIAVIRPLVASIGGGFGALFASLFSGAGGGGGGTAVPLNMNLAAAGGVMTSRGMLSLNRYRSGGIANSPQMAMFGEGSSPEAFVPLPDGRSIPVTMRGGNPDKVSVEIINSGAPKQVDSASPRFDVSGVIVAVTLSDFERNGPISQAMRNNFGVGRRSN